MKQRRHKRTFRSTRYSKKRGRTIIVNPDIISRTQKVNLWKKSRLPKPIGNVNRVEYPTRKDVSNAESDYKVEVGVAVPSTKNRTEQISRGEFNKRIRETLNFLTSLFDGATASTNYGTYYFGEKKVNIGENIVFVKVWTTRKIYAKHDLLLKKWLEKKVKEWQQDSVQFTYADGKGFKNSFLIFRS